MCADNTDVLPVQTTDLLSVQTTALLSAQTTHLLSVQTTDLLSVQTADLLSAHARPSEQPLEAEDPPIPFSRSRSRMRNWVPIFGLAQVVTWGLLVLIRHTYNGAAKLLLKYCTCMFVILVSIHVYGETSLSDSNLRQVDINLAVPNLPVMTG